MRVITGTCGIVGLPGAARAHELAHETGFLARLGHEIFAVHHLPFTLLLLVVLVAALRRMRTAAKSVKSRTKTK